LYQFFFVHDLGVLIINNGIGKGFRVIRFFSRRFKKIGAERLSFFLNRI